MKVEKSIPSLWFSTGFWLEGPSLGVDEATESIRASKSEKFLSEGEESGKPRPGSREKVPPLY